MIINWKGFKIKVREVEGVVIHYSCKDIRALEEYFMITKKTHKKETIVELLEEIINTKKNNLK
jgi:alpha-galactosidase/6-phospho-beta-glucosidase family protein